MSLKELNGNLVEFEINEKHEILSKEYIEEYLVKMEKRIKDQDFSGVITNSKTLLEHIIRDLCKELEIEFNEKNIKKSFQDIQKKINLDPKEYTHDGFKKIITGLINIIDGMAEVRNKTSDSHSRVYNPSEHHAVLCVNASRTFASFIINSYLYQKENGKLKGDQIK